MAVVTIVLVTLLSAPLNVPEEPGLVARTPLFVNPYSPFLGGINCNEDCGHFGNGWPVTPDLMGRVAACNPMHIGCTVEFGNGYGSAGPFLCIESGGMLLQPRYRDGVWVQYVDVFWDIIGADGKLDYGKLPWWNNATFYEYSFTCN